MDKNKLKRYEEIKIKIANIQERLDYTFNDTTIKELRAELINLSKERDKLLGL